LFLFETLSLREEKEKVIEYIYFCDKKFNFSVNKFYLIKKKSLIKVLFILYLASSLFFLFFA
jgi:hypothetical protein